MARLLGHQPTAVLDSLPAPTPDTHIDTARGEQLWGGRLPHGQAIRRFLAEQSGGDGAAGGLRQWAAAPLAEQLQTAHRLRGAAANLCLPRLTQLATDLETDLKGPPGPQATATQSAWLALEAECDALAALVGPGDAAAPAAAGGLDRPEALRLVQHLAQALERGGLDDQALQDLGTALGADGQSRWTPVQQALDDFDFDLASRHLKALQAWLTDLGEDRA
jgi:HPt (histidine-containing phosphotransfer) domain-containing protein